MEQVKKVVRLNENPKGNEEEVEIDDGGGERDENEISDMDKLPPEMLTKILDYLDEQDLIKCRLLSSRWNEISCLLLQDKIKNNRKSKLVVELNQPLGKESLECKIVVTKSIDEFLDCFAPSEVEKSSGRRRPFPFSPFYIADLHVMDMDQMTRFVPLLHHIKVLFLEINNKETKKFETFWRLLLKFAPNIERLGLGGAYWHEMNLFEPYFNFKANSDPLEIGGDKSQNQEITFLNKLKTMEIKLEEVHLVQEDEVTTALYPLLKHSPNLQRLICRIPGNRFTSISGPFFFLKVWQELNRSHLLKKLRIRNPPDESISFGESTPAELMENLQLADLTANFAVDPGSVRNAELITNYIYHALKSSQNTLSKLNLLKLSVESMNFCFKDIKSFPNVRHLKIQIQNGMETGKVLERVCQLCPNLTSLCIKYFGGEISQLARTLWTQFTGLKTLKFSVEMRDEKNTLLLVDSAFSGYSQESIQNIQTKLELDEGISLEEARQNEKQNPSILELKDLRRLELEFLMRKRTSESEKVENQLRNSVFMKILPQHIREYPRSILYRYAD